MLRIILKRMQTFAYVHQIGRMRILGTMLVTKGYSQTHGVDYEETFAPVAKMTIVWTVIALVAAKGWHLHQMDDKKKDFLQ